MMIAVPPHASQTPAPSPPLSQLDTPMNSVNKPIDPMIGHFVPCGT